VAGGGHGAIDGAAAALFAAGIAARLRGRVLWCLTRQDLFAPALAQAGLVPDRVIYVEAGDEKSVLICFEEGLWHGGLGAIVAEVARLSMTASRSLQRAAKDRRRLCRERARLPPEMAMVSKAVPRPSYNPAKKRPACDRAPLRFQLFHTAAAFGQSLDLEIIAQGEANEKHEDDRNEVLRDH
jgi:protein ImuA